MFVSESSLDVCLFHEYFEFAIFVRLSSLKLVGTAIRLEMQRKPGVDQSGLYVLSRPYLKFQQVNI